MNVTINVISSQDPMSFEQCLDEVKALASSDPNIYKATLTLAGKEGKKLFYYEYWTASADLRDVDPHSPPDDALLVKRETALPLTPEEITWRKKRDRRQVELETKAQQDKRLQNLARKQAELDAENRVDTCDEAWLSEEMSPPPVYLYY